MARRQKDTGLGISEDCYENTAARSSSLPHQGDDPKECDP